MLQTAPDPPFLCDPQPYTMQYALQYYGKIRIYDTTNELATIIRSNGPLYASRTTLQDSGASRVNLLEALFGPSKPVLTDGKVVGYKG